MTANWNPNPLKPWLPWVEKGRLTYFHPGREMIKKK